MSGDDAVLFAGEERTGPAHAAHDLVQDQQHAVAVADLANPHEVARRRRHRPGGCADHGLGHERRMTVSGPSALDLLLQRLGGPLAVGLGALVRAR